MSEPREGGRRTSEVRFDAGAGNTGYVVVRRLPEGSLPYVARVESAKFDNVMLEREAGRVQVEAYSRAPGTLVARVGSLGSEWEAEQSVPVDIEHVRVTLAVDQDEYPQVIQLRHEGVDGTIGIGVFRVQPVAPPAGSTPRGDRLSPASPVGLSGIGPVSFGMTLEETLIESGAPMVLRSSPYCDVLLPVDLEGVAFITGSQGDGHVLVATVSTPVLATESGIRVGSSEADVLAAYPGIEVRSTQFRRLIDHADDDNRALVFEVRDSQVIAILAGIGADTDELCG